MIIIVLLNHYYTSHIDSTVFFVTVFISFTYDIDILQVLSHHSSGNIIHKSFIRGYREGFFSLGFKKKNKEMVYMKPHPSEKRIKTTEEECFCFEVPEIPLTDEHLLSLNINWHMIIEARVELDGK